MNHHVMHRVKISCAVVLLAAAVTGCAREGIPIGEAEADRATIAGHALFAHYMGTLQGATTVGDLMTQTLQFTARPTPRALLRSMQASNPPASSNAVPLTVVSYNVAMLDVALFGVVPYARTPWLDERRAVLPQAVFARGYDIIGLQEVWSPSDLERMRTVGASMGYWVVASSRDGYTDGLAIAVRRAIAPAPGDVMFEQYTEISDNEFFPAPGVSRGLLAVRFQHVSLGSTVVYVSHTASFPAAYPLRMKQARELGLHARANVRPDELLFILGDFNAAPYYRADVWELPDGTREPSWYANTLSYPVLMHYTGAVDLAIRGRSAADADLDITVGDGVPNNPTQAMAVPYGVPGYCATVPRDAFTATDCNPIYFAQYAATEFAARIDFVLGRDPGTRMHVAESRVVFTEPVAYGNTMGPLSDHYGQYVRLLVAPR
jgi:endonuclease/exonuclease/phosphatase family metal-dependent hydrolase